MPNPSNPVKPLLALIVILAIAAVAVARLWNTTTEEAAWLGPAVGSAGPGSTYDCPHDIRIEQHAIPMVDTVVDLAGPITSIPEFHDCQRFLVNGGKEYGPLVSIFVSIAAGVAKWPGDGSENDSILVGSLGGRGGLNYELKLPGQGPRNVFVPARATFKQALPVAVVYTWGDSKPATSSSYPDLGISRDETSGWNCLYLTASREALMAKVSEDEDCVAPQAEAELLLRGATRLSVHQINATDAPSAGRWDYDSRRGKQFISMACPGGWCEIGMEEFGPSREHDLSKVSPGDMSRFSIKPWYDEQLLGVKSPGADVLVPSTTLGTLVPTTESAAWDEQAFAGEWKHVAWMFANRDDSKYADRLNLPRTEPDPKQMATLEFCNGLGNESCQIPDELVDELGNGGECVDEADPWWAKITTTRPENRWFWRVVGGREWRTRIQYHCVDRHVHKNAPVPIPPTARWRWDLKDEGPWAKCGPACCRGT
jgi:hypothetical protein